MVGCTCVGCLLAAAVARPAAAAMHEGEMRWSLARLRQALPLAPLISTVLQRLRLPGRLTDFVPRARGRSGRGSGCSECPECVWATEIAAEAADTDCGGAGGGAR